MQDNKTEKSLTVIIPTLNRAKLLHQTLQSIVVQTFPRERYEIIVIDNGSTDKTQKVCMDYQKENGNLKYIYDDRPGLHIGRNRGFLESTTDILVYADDDIIAFPSWLETIYEGFKDEKTVLIGGNNYPYFEKKPPEWVKGLWTYNKKEQAKRLESYSIIIIGDTARRVSPGMIFGCNFAVRKEIIKRAGGFHPDGVPQKYLKYRGDGESYITGGYIQRYNLKAMFYPGASIYHVVTEQKMTKEYVRKVSYRTGISAGFARMRSVTSIKEIFVLLYEAVKNLYLSSNGKGIAAMKRYFYCKGYLYIVLQFCTNKKVRKWIRLDNYINADILEAL